MRALSLLALLLIGSGCSAAYSPRSALDSSDGAPGGSTGNTAAGSPTGSALVDVLASSFEVDKTTATADGQDAISLTIRLVTPSGTGAVAVPVTVAMSGSGNTIVPATVLTESNGAVTVALRSTKAEGKELSVRVQQGSLGSTSIAFVPGPVDPARSLLTSSPRHQRANGTDEAVITFALRDATDNPIPSSAVTVTIGGDGNTVSVGGSAQPTSAGAGSSDVVGAFAVRVRSTVAETKLITATAGGVTMTGSMRFVADWFLAAGAPYGQSFACSAVEPSVAVWHVITERGAFTSAGEEFAHHAAPPVNALCRDLAIDASVSPAKLYAAFADDHVRRLDAAGWTNVGNTKPGMRSVFVDDRTAIQALWLAGDGSTEVHKLSAGVWTPDDSGIVAATGPNGPGANDFAVSGDVLYVATNAGVYSRASAASSWTLLSGMTKPTAAIRVAAEGAARTLYAATDEGIWRRPLVPPGSWEDVSMGVPIADCQPGPCSTPVRVRAIAIDDSATPARLFAATEETITLASPPSTVTQSRLLSKKTNDAAWTLATAQPAAQNERIERIRVVAARAVVAVEKRGLYQLDASLTTAEKLGAALPAYAIDGVAYDPNEERLFAVMSAGLYRSNDFGEHWVAIPLGTAEPPIAITVDGARTPAHIVVSTAAPAPAVTFHVLESLDGGTSFTDTSDGLGALTSLPATILGFATAARTLFASDGASLFARSAQTYDELTLTPTPSALYSLDDVGSSLVIGTDQGALVLGEGGTTAPTGGLGARAVRRTTSDISGAMWFATDLGVFVKPAGTGSAVRIDDPGATATRSFLSIASDTMRGKLFAIASVSATEPPIFLFPASQSATPVAVTQSLAPGVSPRTLTVATKLGSDAPPLVLVGFEGSGGLHASLYE